MNHCFSAPSKLCSACDNQHNQQTTTLRHRNQNRTAHKPRHEKKCTENQKPQQTKKKEKTKTPSKKPTNPNHKQHSNRQLKNKDTPHMDERFLRYMAFFYTARNRHEPMPVQVTTRLCYAEAGLTDIKVKIVR